MAFDECPSSVASREYVQNSVDRTTRWLQRCKDEMARLNSLPDTVNPHQLLFGINQGAIYDDIRIAHAETISKMDLDGYAVGGLAVGETHEEMYRILDSVVPHLPVNKPTYLMGVGILPIFWRQCQEAWISLTAFTLAVTDAMDMYTPILEK